MVVGFILETDYEDYWDNDFKNRQQDFNVLTFKRLRYPPVPIQRQVALLEQMRREPPLNGTPDEIAQSLPQEDPEVAVYARDSFDLIDKCPLSVAMLKYRDYFCVQQLQFPDGLVRHLQVGNRAWVWQIKNIDNECVVKSLIGEAEPFWHSLLEQFPLFSVDLVQGRAIAFSLTPTAERKWN